MSTAIAAPWYPIIYVRGYAATMGEIEATTADPYMGFNIGSTMVRQNAAKDVVRFIFESPLVRLMKDHGYVDAFHNGGNDHDPGTVPAKSVWVYRYYEPVSKSLGEGKRLTMEEFAEGLREFILQVRDAVCGGDAAARKAFKVHLVAHSMGGLICRAYLQNTCRHGTGDAKRDTVLELSAGAPSDPMVDKVYTYGTPHNGIDFGPMNAPNLGPLDQMHVSNFNRKRMREYLRLPKDAPANSLDGAFPVQRFFCFIGSNHRDYDAFYGVSKYAAGSMSDGLVKIENAYVQGTPRALAYRSHSGPYGLVNSEAGYQNLRRFLFGSVRVTVTLEVDELLLPKAVQEQKDAGRQVRGSYHIDVSSQVRGAATYHLNERRYDQQSAILMAYDDLVKKGKPVYLFTGYLTEAARAASDRALMFSVDFGVHVPAFEVEKRFWFNNHFEGFLFQETVSFAIREGSIRFGLASENGLGEATRMAEETTLADGSREIRVKLGSRSGIRPGFQGTLVLRAEPWG